MSHEMKQELNSKLKLHNFVVQGMRTNQINPHLAYIKQEELSFPTTVVIYIGTNDFLDYDQLQLIKATVTMLIQTKQIVDRFLLLEARSLYLHGIDGRK